VAAQLVASQEGLSSMELVRDASGVSSWHCYSLQHVLYRKKEVVIISRASIGHSAEVKHGSEVAFE
jgi:hypothetical protein